MSIKERMKNIKWDEGAAEFLSFCFMCPAVLFFILIFLDMAIYVRAGQIAEYCAYIGGRTAVITSQDSSSETSERVNHAQTTANSIVADTMASSGYLEIDEGDVASKQWKGKIELSDSTAEWAKGSLMDYSITMGVPRFTTSDCFVTSSTITMMIETPILSGTKLGN